MSKEVRIPFDEATDEQLRCAASVYGCDEAFIHSCEDGKGNLTSAGRQILITELLLCDCKEIVVRGGFTTAE